ncbi:hypothetical protein [Calothrix sp. 336/3]|uniref:hypothetical protein n=1 Tax=Calothrix sp. 336/3 TaxID=1337936 RepID=UPI0004E3584B|nr:hypothetical protein [Calothrix sp. 336/3]AKG23098.1 hypothetical protein IJ00_19120 [Calothrix sp. 336/3]
MSLRNEPLDWHLGESEKYLPIYYQNEIAGFFKQEYADEIIRFLNEEARLTKALQKACQDLLKSSGADAPQVKDLMKKYIKMSEPAKHGTRAIAQLLKERQVELDLGKQEFSKFCDSFKVSPLELDSIYAGEPLDDNLLLPLSRILGVPKERLQEIRDKKRE